MEIETSSNNVTINGNIKTVNDFQKIKEAIDEVISESDSINLHITDSISITSSIIGYLNKLVLKDNIDIQMKVGEQKLLELLDDLNLVSTFNAKKI